MTVLIKVLRHSSKNIRKLESNNDNPPTSIIAYWGIFRQCSISRCGIGYEWRWGVS